MILEDLSNKSIKPKAWFHAYVLCGFIGIRWGKFGPGFANSNVKLRKILTQYLVDACGDDEWTKGRVLEAMRYKTSIKMKRIMRHILPSLYSGKRLRPLAIPEELKDEITVLNVDQIIKWRDEVRQIKKEIAMSENAVADQPTDNTSSANNRVTVNFFIPSGTDAESLTLDNYREVTGKRFRMTKDQKSRGLSREDAFAESRTLAMNNQGDN